MLDQPRLFVSAPLGEHLLGEGIGLAEGHELGDALLLPMRKVAPRFIGLRIRVKRDERA